MSALQKLQEKIEQWKDNHEALKTQNNDLKSQLAGVATTQNDQDSRIEELQAELNKCAQKDETITALQRELTEKDDEIEKIIAQVEALLA